MEWRREAYRISTDRNRLDLSAIHEFLRGSYWASGIPREVVEKSIRNSLSFGVYDAKGLVGFARVVTDYATFAYLADVFVLPAHRGRGLATWLMEVIHGHPDLRGLRRWMLATRDAHGLYRKSGFVELENPGRFMEIVDRDVYR